MFNYGDIVASDFVHLLENFSHSIPPVYPIQGQLWYKNDTKELFVYDNGAFTTQSIVINGLLTEPLDVNDNRIVNVSDPVNPQDAVTKNFLSTTYVQRAGDDMMIGANLSFAGGEVLFLPPVPSDDLAATSKIYVDTQDQAVLSNIAASYVHITGDTVTGNLIMAANTHIILPTPTPSGFILDGEVVNKAYVDALLAGGTGLVHITGDTMTGPLVFDGTTFISGPAISLVNNASLSLDGDLNVIGTHLVDVGFNRIQSVETPIANDDAATKNYVDTALSVAMSSGGDGTLISVSFVNNTLTFTSTTGSPIVVPGVSDTSHIHTASSIRHNITSVANLNSTFRETFDNTVPSVPLSTVLDNIDMAIHGVTGPNDRVLYPITAPGLETITAGLQTVDVGFIQVDASPTGLVGATTYTANVAVDGVPTPISILGSTALTYAALIVQLNTDLYGAFAALVNGNITITSSSTGVLSTILITDTGLFSALTGFVSILPAEDGTYDDGIVNPFNITLPFAYAVEHNALQVYRNGIKQYLSTRGFATITCLAPTPSLFSWYDTSIPAGSYSFDVVFDGGGTDTINVDVSYVPIAISSVNNTTNTWVFLGNLLNRFNQFSIFNVVGDTGLGSTQPYTVQSVVTSGGKTGSANTNLVSATTYTATITVDGTPHAISILGSSATTYTNLLTQINIDLGAAATAFLVGGDIKITSSTVGTGSSVSITPGTLFASPLAGFAGIPLATPGTLTSSGYQLVAVGATTSVTVLEDFAGANSTGHVVYPYTFNNLITNIQQAFDDIYSFTPPPIITLYNGVIYIYSPSIGAGSSVVLTDVSLLTASTVYSFDVVNNIGIDYGYNELGNPYTTSNTVSILTLPVIGDIYEFINIQ
jgi:hypothetical protein